MLKTICHLRFANAATGNAVSLGVPWVPDSLVLLS